MKAIVAHEKKHEDCSTLGGKRVLKGGDVLLLENLRFHPGEQTADIVARVAKL